MKTLLFSLLIPVLVDSAFAQGFQADSILLKKGENTPIRAWILLATKNEIRYKTTEVSTDFVDAKISDFSTIYVQEPNAFAATLDLYEARNYQEAKAKFIEIKEKFKPIATLPNNFHTLAAFYEMECMRNLGEYDKLAEALKSFNKEPLIQEQHLRQLELYVMWDAVRAAAWDRVLSIATERDEESLPGFQRVQVAYCKGLALEQSNQLADALIHYNIAMTADSGASQVLAQQAALKALGVYLKDPMVQDAMKKWGKEDEVKNSSSYNKLIAAGALAQFYQKYLSLGEALPADLNKLLQYKDLTTESSNETEENKNPEETKKPKEGKKSK
jgi:hypothetical protein